MQSLSERALDALRLRLATLPGVEVRRNEVLPVGIPPAGYLNLLDGDPGEPAVTMSPLLYHFDHMAELEVIVDALDADASFDALRVAIGGVLSLDPTLGGLVDWLEPSAPAPIDLPFEGAAAVKAATIPIRLVYATPNPLL